jgi:hypothetical protein
MSIQNICTPQELKKFADTSPLTITKLLEFIEAKIDKQYVIVQKEFVQDISKLMFDNDISIFDLNGFFNKVWEKITDNNRKTIKKWEEILKRFEIKKD